MILEGKKSDNTCRHILILSEANKILFYRDMNKFAAPIIPVWPDTCYALTDASTRGRGGERHKANGWRINIVTHRCFHPACLLAC